MPDRTCSVDGCERPHKARGWCVAHYRRWQAHGDPLVAVPIGSPGNERSRTCSIEGCERKVFGHGWCNAHYSRWRRRGSPTAGPDRPRQSIEERFWSKVDQSGSCWLWTGTTAGAGYGVLNLDGGRMYAHRWSYEHHVGPIPDGLTIDHLCRTPLCLRPDHLDRGEKRRRAMGKLPRAAFLEERRKAKN